MATTAPHPEWTLTPIAADFNYILTLAVAGSKIQPQSQLHLPWIKHSPRRAITCIRRAFKEVLCCRTSLRCGIEITEIRGAINGIEIFYVYRVEEVESFSNGFHAKALSRLKNA